MAEMRTDEETIEAIKGWWKQNGTSLLIGVVAALAIVFGWQAWQQQQVDYRTEAASQFASLINAYTDESEENRAETVEFVANNLREEYSDSAYAVYGSLILARQQMMDQGDTEAAISTLEWANSKADQGKPLALIIRGRLARAQFDIADYDAALKTIDGASGAESFEAIFSELRGDILLAQGNADGAREAYKKAREKSDAERSGILELKLADLGVGEAS
ncbi:YfgM family protein [Marinobacter sp.]|uniref:YfgM family protein n=1 Tax=Marinobacter sp. TaxID=50741 RepID=UPI002B46DFFD|nr:tetratricopeptide repeat protein [Marinobacter sp.]HKK55380.1 tetratricopeptide repeat protein [Marinobacter sp.]